VRAWGLALVVVIGAATPLLVGGPGERSTGRLRQLLEPGCVSTARGNGCTRGRALAGASWVAVSADGRDVYVGAGRSSAVDTFARARRTGALRQLRGRAGCVAPTGRGGCAVGRGLRAARPVELSGDGRNLYAGTLNGLAVFARDRRTGVLRQLAGARGCVAESGVEGCGRGRGLAAVRALAVARDGRFVYAAARGDDAVTVFARSSRSGALRQLPGAAGCLSEQARAACGRGRGLDGGRGVVFSPDQRFVYVTAEDGDSVAVFARDPRTGRLAQLAGRAGCLQRRGADACAELSTVASPHHVVISGDGRFAYVAADALGAVVILRHDVQTGRLSPIAGRRGCLASPGGRRCGSARGLAAAHSLAFAPGDRLLYVVGRADHAIAVLARNPVTGALSQAAGPAGCIGRIRVSGCAPARGLRGVHSVAASGDGRDVYAASELDDAVVSLAARRP
jgi:DNA-binding beta-propeller fold protein YncE